MTNALRVVAVGLAASLYASSFSGKETTDRVLLFPRLAAGQTVAYDVSYRAVTTTNAESPVAAPMAPPAGQTEVHLLLRVEALNVSGEPAKPSARLRTLLFDPNAMPAAASGERIPKKSEAKAIEFTFLANGEVTGAEGLGALSADEAAAWQQWVARFGVGAALPEKGLRPGAKWHVEEPITSALLTGLSWDKESQYVDDEPCGVAEEGKGKEPAAASDVGDRCAVILTTAVLKQKSPQKEATPDDYKLHDLRTYGVAKGKNEVISYISVKTGIVVRATEDANQSLNVIVAKSDGSNRVHYVIGAQSHSQIRLIANSSLP